MPGERERHDHLLDVLGQESKKRVLPTHAFRICAVEPDDEIACSENPPGRAARERLPTRGQSQSVPLGEPLRK